jgi:hypothetical protein
MKRDDSSRKTARGATAAAKQPQSKQAQAKQRAVRRCPFVASAEVTDLSSETRISARTSELSVGGCYIETLNPFAEGTLVSLRVLRDQGIFETKAKVVYSHQHSGMGLAFTDALPKAQRAILEDWLAEIVLQFRSAS